LKVNFPGDFEGDENLLLQDLTRCNYEDLTAVRIKLRPWRCGKSTTNWPFSRLFARKLIVNEAYLLQTLRENPFVLAPMAAITDCAFRSFMKEMGSEILVSELVSAKGLQYSSEKTKKLMRFDRVQSPVGIQLFGEDADSLSEACKYVESQGADFIDLNLGCPVPKVVKKGAGSALLKDLPSLAKILSAMKSATTLPVTIKIRTGWDAHSRNALDVCKLAHEEGITWVAIHGRTRAQAYEGKADWDFLKQVKLESPVPVIGNGDIVSSELAVDRLKDSGCDGVMIARGALKNPWIFQESMMRLRGEEPDVKRDFMKTFERLKYWYEMHDDERTISLQLKKFASWFSAGYPGSAAFRKSLFQAKSIDEVVERVEEYYLPLDSIIQEDTSEERFLMGGHG
jgi:tRNA-dihydrouridine synthase B